MAGSMKFLEERHQLVELGRDLINWRMLDCAGGAVSIRLAAGDILMSTTASAFCCWKVGVEELILLAPNGEITEQTGGLGASGTPVHLATFDTLGDVPLNRGPGEPGVQSAVSSPKEGSLQRDRIVAC